MNDFRLIRGVGIIVFFLVAAWSHAKDFDKEIRAQRDELARLKKALNAERQALKKLAKEKTSVVSQIDKTVQNIGLVQTYVKKLESTYKTLSQSQNQKTEDLKALQSSLHKRYAVMGARVRSLYIKGKGEALFYRSPHLNEFNFLKRLYFFRKILAYDRALVESTRQDERRKQEVLQYLRSRIKEVQSFKEYKSKEKKRYTGVLRDLEKDMASLQKSEETKRLALGEIERNAKALERIIKTLEAQRKKALLEKKKEKPLDTKGKFCKPVAGQVVTKFGKQFHATLKTMTRSLGVEFKGESGGKVLSAASGEVVYVDVIPGYGKGIIIYSGSGYYNIYGSLGKIHVRPGEQVTGCQEIATLPEKPMGSPSKVYFEVRKEKMPMDPVKWLESMIN